MLSWQIFLLLFRNGNCACTYSYAIRYKILFHCIRYLQFILRMFVFFFNGMWVWMLGLVCLACSFILLIASPFFVHQGPRWKITVEITPVTWNLIILRDRNSFLRQIELWFNCPRLFLCLFSFPIWFASLVGNCSQSSIPCRAEIDRRSWRKTDSQALNATFLEVFLDSLV